MSISNCFIQMNRLDLTKTKCPFIMEPEDGVIECGWMLTFTIRVWTLAEDDVLGGTVSIIDYNTKEVLCEADNVTGLTAIIMGYPENGLDGYRQVYAHFSGTTDGYSASSSENRVIYVIKSKSTIAVTPPSSHSITAASEGLVYFALTEESENFAYPKGTVSFKLYSDNETIIGHIATVTLTSATATATIPANTMTAGNRYYIAAYYSGNKCIEPSCTNIGTSGYYINAT